LDCKHITIFLAMECLFTTNSKSY